MGLKMRNSIVVYLLAAMPLACTRVEDIPAQSNEDTTSQAPKETTQGATTSNVNTDTNANAPTSTPSSSEESQGSTGESSASPTQGNSSSLEDGPATTSADEPADTGECKNGETAECGELEDGSVVKFPSGTPLGSCKLGSKTCSGQAWGKCTGTVGPAPKDKCDVAGDDSDCDGTPNSGCACIDGETRPCGHNDIGECKMGTQSCVGGKWSDQCVGAVLPQKEVCDGKNRDEDCNGSADLDDASCECIDGKEEYCQRSGKKGDCKWGKKTCKQGAWTACNEWARPIDEICGERNREPGVKWTGDEDCDGEVDTSPFGKPGPSGCTRMMMDADRDGFGRIGKDLSQMSKSESLSRLATACLCPSRPDISEKYREGWVRAVPGRANTDCGDCKNEGNLVQPTMTGKTYNEKFDKPSRCLQEIGYAKVYDYNCNGTEEPEFTGAFSCDFDATNGRCVKTGHWYEGEQPGCGETADHVSGGSSCTLADDVCETAILGKLPQKTQSCG